MSKQPSTNYHENVKKGLDYLKGSDRIVGDIINYCVNEYKQSPTPKSIGIVQKYLQDTADSVSDHVLNIAHNISKMLEQQVREIDLLNYDTQFISHRLSISESYMSSLMMTKFQTYPRPRKTIHILRKTLPDEQLPKSARRRAAWKRQKEFNYKLLDKVGKNVVSTDNSNQSGTKSTGYHKKRDSQSMTLSNVGITNVGPQNPPPPTFSTYQSSSNILKNKSNNIPKPQPGGEGEGSPGSPVSPPNPPKPPQPFSNNNNNNAPPNPPKPPQPFSQPPPQPFSQPPNPPNPPNPPKQNNGPPNPPKPPQPFSQPKPKPFVNNNNNNNNNNGPPNPPKPPNPPQNNGPPNPPKPPNPPNMGGPPPVPKTGGPPPVPKTGGPPPVPNMGGPPKPPNPPNVGGPPPPPNMGGGPPPVPNMGGPPPVPQGNNNQVPDEFKPYIKMVNMGVPRVAVNGKMQREGYNPSDLDQYL